PWLLAEDLLVNTAQAIFDEVVTGPYAIRLLGLSMSNLQPSGFEEMTLF
ncbi:DinB/UmuC family translesion DNA polymerase, partial [Leuconostoc lactis]